MSTFSKELQKELDGLFKEAVSETGISDDNLPRLLTLLIAKKSANNLSEDELEILRWIQTENAKKPHVDDKKEVVPTKRGRVIVHDDEAEEDPTDDDEEVEIDEAELEEEDPTDDNDEVEVAEAEESGSFSERFEDVNWFLVTGVLLGLIAVLFLGIRFVLPMIQAATNSGLQEVEVIDLNPIPQQQVNLTGPVQNILLKADALVAKFSHPLVLAMLILNAIGFMYYAFDRGFDFDLEDTPMFLMAIALFMIGILLPLDQWLGASGETVYLGKMLIVSPRMKMDLFLVFLTEVLLLYISISGNKDFTSMSLGNLFMGDILLITYVSNFNSWFPPVIVVICWILVAVFHIWELNNQENFKQSMFIAIIGLCIEMGLFVFILTQSHPTSVFEVQNHQLLSFLKSLGIVSSVIAILMVIGLKTTWLAPARGLQNAIETALFDVLLLIGPYGGHAVLMILWWSSPI